MCPHAWPTRAHAHRYVGPGAEDIETDLDELEVLRTLIDHGINMREAYLVHLRVSALHHCTTHPPTAHTGDAVDLHTTLQDGMGASRGPLKDVYSGQWRAGLKHGRGSEIGLTVQH